MIVVTAPLKIELDFPGTVPAAQQVVFEGLKWISNEPCFSEFEIYGEFCGVFVQGGEPELLHFKPSVPAPDFEVRWGPLGDLRNGKGFSSAECLGRFSAGPAEPLLPDPLPGEGLYFITRGTNMCLARPASLAGLAPRLPVTEPLRRPTHDWSVAVLPCTTVISDVAAPLRSPIAGSALFTIPVPEARWHPVAANGLLMAASQPAARSASAAVGGRTVSGRNRRRCGWRPVIPILY